MQVRRAHCIFRSGFAEGCWHGEWFLVICWDVLPSSTWYGKLMWSFSNLQLYLQEFDKLLYLPFIAGVWIACLEWAAVVLGRAGSYVSLCSPEYKLQICISHLLYRYLNPLELDSIRCTSITMSLLPKQLWSISCSIIITVILSKSSCRSSCCSSQIQFQVKFPLLHSALLSWTIVLHCD